MPHQHSAGASRSPVVVQVCLRCWGPGWGLSELQGVGKVLCILSIFHMSGIWLLSYLGVPELGSKVANAPAWHAVRAKCQQHTLNCQPLVSIPQVHRCRPTGHTCPCELFWVKVLAGTEATRAEFCGVLQRPVSPGWQRAERLGAEVRHQAVPDVTPVLCLLPPWIHRP